MKFSGFTILQNVEFSIILYIDFCVGAGACDCGMMGWWRKLFMCLCHQAVYFGTGLRVVSPTFGKVRVVPSESN